LERQLELLDGGSSGVQRVVGLVRRVEICAPRREPQMGSRAARVQEGKGKLPPHENSPEPNWSRFERQTVQRQIRLRMRSKFFSFKEAKPPL